MVYSLCSRTKCLSKAIWNFIIIFQAMRKNFLDGTFFGERLSAREMNTRETASATKKVLEAKISRPAAKN